MDNNETIRQQCLTAKRRAMAAGCMPSRVRDDVIRRVGERLASDCAALLEANSRDVERAQGQLPQGLLERLWLDEGRISGLRERLMSLAASPDPLWRGQCQRVGGDDVVSLAAPVGAVGFVCRACPELLVTAVALCIKTGNAAVILSDISGGETDAALCDCIRSALSGSAYPPEAFVFVGGAQSGIIGDAARGELGIDLLVHRGRRDEFRRLRDGARLPIISPGQGISHIYVDGDCDIDAAVAMTVRSIYPRDPEAGASVVLLVHNRVSAAYLAALEQSALPYRPEYRACPVAREHLTDAVPAVRDDWSSDGLWEGNIIAIHAVATADEAIEHINAYGTASAQAIISGRLGVIRRFCREVSATELRVNTPLPRRDTPRAEWFVRERKVYVGG